ncbi:MAG: Ig-like domain repeat protein [Deltaproteobacteria bacterium]|nr:Ig-like domain repeat protein [Nannocystaceae bacterium]
MRAVSPTLGLFAALATVFLLAPIGVSEAAPPQMQPKDRPQVEPAKPVVIKKFTKLETKNAAAVPGETRNVEATLKAGQSPLAGKTVRFRFKGKNDGPSANFDIGSAVTNAQGKATIAWKVPELAQAAYSLEATFAGDDDTRAASDEANFALFKGTTKFDVDYNYGALDSHGGPHFGTLLIALRRQSDDAALTKTFKVTINEGQSTQAIKDYTTTSGFVTVLLPDQTNTWKVKIQFFGDSANQATQHDKTYSH